MVETSSFKTHFLTKSFYKMKKFIQSSLACLAILALLFSSSCTKSGNESDDPIQQKLDELSRTLAPGSHQLEAGVQLYDWATQTPVGGELQERCPTCPNTPVPVDQNCIAVILVNLGAGSTLIVDGVGSFVGPINNLTVSFPITSGQQVNVAYGGKTGTSVVQLNTGGCLIFSVAPSTKYRLVTATLRLFCGILC